MCQALADMGKGRGVYCNSNGCTQFPAQCSAIHFSFRITQALMTPLFFPRSFIVEPAGRGSCPANGADMILDDFNLKGKVALVTGGATGIGLGIATGLAEAGASIACVYQQSDPGEIRSITEKNGGEFLGVQIDIARMENIPVLIQAVLTRFGRIDILVNNSGICPRQSALDYTEETWDNVIQLNQKTVFFLSQAVARQFRKQGSKGKIINIASMLSYLGGFNTTAYTASKHAVMGLTKVLASEWGGFGITVNAVAPGWIKTNLSKPLRDDPERDQSVKARIPQGDWGEPADFKGVAVLLASAASDYINGVCIPVDGGYLTK